MFAQDLCHSRIEYLRNAIDVNRKDRASRLRHSSLATTAESDSSNPQSKISFSGFAGLGCK